MMKERANAFKKCQGKETRSSQTDILWNPGVRKRSINIRCER